MGELTFGSVCSGIEAASVAWEPLGWRAEWFAEIEPFPSAVLAHHYPAVNNLGDMTKIAAKVLTGEVAAPDVLCGGTPCQAFSVAGLRQSMADKRGGLTLKFVELANAIDHVRGLRGDEPAIVFWENVPGVLSTSDNAFGCFIGALVGESDALKPAGGRWTNAGCVYGPQRAAAWRVLDAQYFGVAQRRRRVFVVASAREGFDPAAVLFEFDGVRRDSAPRREAGEAAARGAAPCLDASFGRLQGCSGQDANHGHGHLIADTTHTLRGEGFDASEGGTGRGTPLVPVAGGHFCHRCGEPSGQTCALCGLGDCVTAMPVAFDTTQVTSATNRSNPQPGDPCHPLASGAHAPAIAFPANLSGTQHASTENLSPAMGAANPTAVAYTTKLHNTGSNNAGKLFEERTTCLDANSPPPALLTAMQVRRLTPRECERLQGFPDDYTAIPWRGKPADQCSDGPRYKALGNSWAVPNVRWIGARIDRQLKAATC